MTVMILQVQKVAVSRCSYTQKADENVALQHKASPSLAAQFLKNYREKNHLTQVQLAEDLPEGRATHLARLGEQREKPTEVAT
jgi:hypothetical protein